MLYIQQTIDHSHLKEILRLVAWIKARFLKNIQEYDYWKKTAML